MRAPELTRSPDDRTLSIATPLFLIPDAEGERWELRSKTGWVAADNSEVRLRGEVEATSPPSDARPLGMPTEQLTILPDEDDARATSMDTVTRPTSKIRDT